MNIFDSYVDAGQELSKRDREKYYTALIEFIAYGREPSLSGGAKAVFTAIRPSLEISMKRSSSGRAGANKTNAKRHRSDQQNEVSPSEEESAKRQFADRQNEDLETGKTDGKPTSKQPASEAANGSGNSKGKSKGKEAPPSGGAEKAPRRFRPPTAGEVAEYAASKGLAIDAGRFVDFYASKGWKVGSTGMKDWRAAVRNWCRRDAPTAAAGAQKGGTSDDFSKYDLRDRVEYRA